MPPKDKCFVSIWLYDFPPLPLVSPDLTSGPRATGVQSPTPR